MNFVEWWNSNDIRKEYLYMLYYPNDNLKSDKKLLKKLRSTSLYIDEYEIYTNILIIQSIENKNNLIL